MENIKGKRTILYAIALTVIFFSNIACVGRRAGAGCADFES